MGGRERRGEGEGGKVVVKEDAFIPSRSEVVLGGLVPGICSDVVYGLIEPSEVFLERQNVLVARSMSRAEKGEVFVRVMNISSEPVELKAKMTLGSFSPIYCAILCIKKCISNKMTTIINMALSQT